MSSFSGKSVGPRAGLLKSHSSRGIDEYTGRRIHVRCHGRQAQESEINLTTTFWRRWELHVSATARRKIARSRWPSRSRWRHEKRQGRKVTSWTTRSVHPPWQLATGGRPGGRRCDSRSQTRPLVASVRCQRWRHGRAFGRRVPSESACPKETESGTGAVQGPWFDLILIWYDLSRFFDLIWFLSLFDLIWLIARAAENWIDLILILI